MRRWLFWIVCLLGTACAHSEPSPPPGPARIRPLLQVLFDDRFQSSPRELSPHTQRLPAYQAEIQEPIKWPRVQKRPALAITHVTVIDVTGGPSRPDMTVFVEGNRIAEITPSQGAPTRAGVMVVNGRGKFLIPGLWDMHVHTTVPVLRQPDEKDLPGVEDMLALFVASGVTGVRDMGGWGTYTVDLKRLANSGHILSPTMVVGTMVDGPDGMMSVGYIRLASGPKQARRLVRKIKAEGFDFVKVYSFLPRNIYRAIVDECRRNDIPWVGHVPMEIPLAEVAKEGQRSIEHMGDMFSLEIACSSRERAVRALLNAPLEDNTVMGDAMIKVFDLAMKTYDEKKCAALYEQLARSHTWQVPTLSVFRMAANLGVYSNVYASERRFLPYYIENFWTKAHFDLNAHPKPFREMIKRKQQFYSAQVKEMVKAGVHIMTGTDTPMYTLYPGLSLHYELEDLVAAGLTPLQALQAATIEPARFLGKEGLQGTIEQNSVADMVLLRANPLEDIRNTQEIEAVVLQGHLLTRIQLDQIHEGVARRTEAELANPNRR
ncbi:amidohydrolase family protein [Hyalangium rubrum]|uniref:Amidohydrolase family protein n=1 Tax=Hyalangium rubrum TaxID=3103134 RepID=A0ABU5H120_9BACT|nr:amidohydrolase family protein [Hyalangium sp. s54d21]MDY7227149.1 amidohydrolase family protein [Hyalangium sp. s54d21]